MYILLMLFWIIINGRVTAEILITGAVVIAGVGLLTKALFGYDLRTDIRVLKKSPYVLLFILLVFREVLKANLAVMRLIPVGEERLHPVMVTFHTDLKTDLCRYLFANSITITPGTITVSADGGRFTVHCLSRSLLDTTDSNPILKVLKKLEA